MVFSDSRDAMPYALGILAIVVCLVIAMLRGRHFVVKKIDKQHCRIQLGARALGAYREHLHR